MLEEYFLLVRRIPGIALSIDDYWNMDTWTTAKLLLMEKAIIKEEQKQNPNKDKEYEEQPVGNSEEMNDIVSEMSVEI